MNHLVFSIFRPAYDNRYPYNPTPLGYDTKRALGYDTRYPADPRLSHYNPYDPRLSALSPIHPYDHRLSALSPLTPVNPYDPRLAYDHRLTNLAAYNKTLPISQLASRSGLPISALIPRAGVNDWRTIRLENKVDAKGYHFV